MSEFHKRKMERLKKMERWIDRKLAEIEESKSKPKIDTEQLKQEILELTLDISTQQKWVKELTDFIANATSQEGINTVLLVLKRKKGNVWSVNAQALTEKSKEVQMSID